MCLDYPLAFGVRAAHHEFGERATGERSSLLDGLLLRAVHAKLDSGTLQGRGHGISSRGRLYGKLPYGARGLGALWTATSTSSTAGKPTHVPYFLPKRVKRQTPPRPGWSD